MTRNRRFTIPVLFLSQRGRRQHRFGTFEPRAQGDQILIDGASQTLFQSALSPLLLPCRSRSDSPHPPMMLDDDERDLISESLFSYTRP